MFNICAYEGDDERMYEREKQTRTLTGFDFISIKLSKMRVTGKFYERNNWES